MILQITLQEDIRKRIFNVRIILFQIINPIATFLKTFWRQSLASWIMKETEKLRKTELKAWFQNSEEKDKDKNTMMSRMTRDYKK